MSYVKQNFTNGTVLTADHLNNIENQIAINEENISNKVDASHAHDDMYYTEAEIDDKLSSKSDDGHSHTISEISDISNATVARANAIEWSGIENKPDSYTPSVHSHQVSEIDNLQSVIDGIEGEVDKKYEKLSSGIPKTDLSSDVQLSLGKADSAVQSLDGYATVSYVDSTVAGIVDSAPEALNTLNELSAALGNDKDFATTVSTEIGKKATKSDLDDHVKNISNPHNVTVEQINAVPISRTVNGVALSSNIELSASDVGADVSGAADGALESAKEYTNTQLSSHTDNTSNPHKVTLSQLGVNATATELNHMGGVTSGVQAQIDAKVPTSRTINGKSLSSNITLSSSDVGADASGTAASQAASALTESKSYTDTKVSEVSAAKANISHNHDDIYYTENEMDNKLSVKVDKTPSLTDVQKKALTDLADLYNKNRLSFKYSGPTLRNSYLNSSAFEESRVKVNCGLYCGLLWAGVHPNTFLNYIDNQSAFDGTLEKIFDWGYEFVYPNSKLRGVINNDTNEPYGFIQPNEDNYEGSGSYNSYYDSSVSTSTQTQQQKFFSFQTAADMAWEMYMGGYEVQMKDVEVGDLIFFGTRSLSDGNDDLDESMRFRNITHVAMVTKVIPAGTETSSGVLRDKKINYTESTSMLTDSYAITELVYNSTYNSRLTRMAHYLTHVVMVARHPAAFGNTYSIPGDKFTEL